MEQLAQLVHAQHDVVDSIEEHIEMAHLDVRSAHRDLKKAQAAQTAKYPLVAAAVGGAALGGPVGIAAGSTVAGIFAALGGAVAGQFFICGLFHAPATSSLSGHRSRYRQLTHHIPSKTSLPFLPNKKHTTI
ncbi:unnamed protein product [Gongylonema pulchrum]|uniref:t-SNARE coiled-coil homology domain-containing protein n=1 Tax=Gongylonema pulchrum TaxID=637853 RepID=A0A183EWA3_9BILA|nr:unnamed protein product [Gongylonema pulchrum]